ncbi:MAG: hypothetical protein ABI782_13485, partial [Anaerolineaceae bacterium]
MDGRLALYSGAAFAGVLIAGTLAIRPGFGSGDAGSSGAATAATASAGQQGDSSRFVASVTTSLRRGDDDQKE